MVVVAVAFLAVFFFFRSRTGVAMRATAFDQEAAMAQGIGVGRVFAIAWAVGAGLAAVGGMFATQPPVPRPGPSSGHRLHRLPAFPAVILGGLDSVAGAVVGGLLDRPGRDHRRPYLVRQTDVSGRVPGDHPLRPDADRALRPPLRPVRHPGGQQGMRRAAAPPPLHLLRRRGAMLPTSDAARWPRAGARRAVPVPFALPVSTRSRSAVPRRQ